jgi:rhamnopyranosyl-N-acetylglucosaminyl-diphospho-decaprenol beta-1,3/1,4-galactofuranosyltransferase
MNHSEPKTLIAAVFATMNRAVTAVSCVRALAAQKRPPDLVFVADNCSSDGTAAALESLADLPFPLSVIRMPENGGNAGGVAEAMEAAYAAGADAVWILDDDSWPQPEALASLLRVPLDRNIVRHALQIDPDTGRFTWPMWTAAGSGWQLAFEESDLPTGDWVPSRSSWTGALIPKMVRDEVGPINRELFIRGEDEEYPWRVSQAGVRFEACRGAKMDHPGSQELVHLKLWGKNLFVEPSLSDWKLYYKVRNMVWLKRHQTGSMGAFTMAFAYAMAVSWIDGPSRLPLVCRAARDGWRGKLGKWNHHPA